MPRALRWIAGIAAGVAIFVYVASRFTSSDDRPLRVGTSGIVGVWASPRNGSLSFDKGGHFSAVGLAIPSHDTDICTGSIESGSWVFMGTNSAEGSGSSVSIIGHVSGYRVCEIFINVIQHGKTPQLCVSPDGGQCDGSATFLRQE